MRVLVFDTETSDKYPTKAFLVTAYLGLLAGDGTVLEEWSWVIDQGKEIPEEAAAIHGYTTERVRAEGRKDVQACLAEIHNVINMHCEPPSNVPLVSHNSAYDLTLLNHELKRNGHRPMDFERYPILDTLVCDKGLDVWRKGSRKLVDVAAHYGAEAPGGDAHEARYDAILAGRVALKMRDRLRREYQAAPANDFWAWAMYQQRVWKREQAESFASYMRGEKKAKPKDGIVPDFIAETDWPYQPVVA